MDARYSMPAITAVRVTHLCAMAIAATISSTSIGAGAALLMAISSFRHSTLCRKVLVAAIRATTAIKRLSTALLPTRVLKRHFTLWVTMAILSVMPPKLLLPMWRTPLSRSLQARFFRNSLFIAKVVY